MKRVAKYLLITIVSISMSYSQSLQDNLESMAKANAQSYLGPMVTAFGMGINSGSYHNAKPHSLLGFDIKMGISITPISDEGKLEWIEYDKIKKIPTPLTDHHIYQFILQKKKFIINAEYDEDLNLLEMFEEITNSKIK